MKKDRNTVVESTAPWLSAVSSLLFMAGVDISFCTLHPTSRYIQHAGGTDRRLGSRKCGKTKVFSPQPPLVRSAPARKPLPDYLWKYHPHAPSTVSAAIGNIAVHHCWYLSASWTPFLMKNMTHRSKELYKTQVRLTLRKIHQWAL